MIVVAWHFLGPMQWFTQKQPAQEAQETVVADAVPHGDLPMEKDVQRQPSLQENEPESESEADEAVFDGVKAARAITSVWSKSHMWTLLGM